MVNAKDLGELGYKMQQSSWSREDLSRFTITFIPHPMFSNGFQMERVINEQDLWKILVGETKVEIIHAFKGNRSIGTLDLNTPGGIKDRKPIMEFERMFLGSVSSKEKLIEIMDMIECPHD